MTWYGSPYQSIFMHQIDLLENCKFKNTWENIIVFKWMIITKK